MHNSPATTHPVVSINRRGLRLPGWLHAGWWALFASLAAAFVIDQVSKELALHALLAGPVTVAGVRLHLIANRGVLLGFPAPSWVVVAATAAVIAMALRSTRNRRWTTSLAFGLLTGGALGNLFDRFQGRHFFPDAAVLDWISAGRITFNLADVFVVAGVVMLVFLPSSDPPTDEAHQQPAT
jgi:signal peptidase II